MALALLAARAWGQDAQLIERIELQGAKRTRVETVLSLLPRVPPARFDDAELDDLARRLSNLTIFDSVEVERRERVLHVRVREKWSVIPEFSLGTGKTAADLALELGVSDYNFLGRAALLSLSASREQRGFNFELGLRSHLYARRRWSTGTTIGYVTTGYRFDDGQQWLKTTGTITGWLGSPPLGSPYLSYQTGYAVLYERMEQARGADTPPNGGGFLLTSGLTFDRYRWHDIAPKGVRVFSNAGPGFFLPRSQPRHFVELLLRAAYPITSRLVIAMRIAGSVRARGNPNAGSLVGSFEGVRGLEDSLYRNWAQVFANVELRQVLLAYKRIALQAVLFSDVAQFQRMDADGSRGDSVFALSSGAGLRILPTFLAAGVLRLDLARLLSPHETWLPLFGVTQYF
ncbi:MAG TPA: hypothetical protein VFX59_18200 [Polyangiales bacterium]|nr:hypothetical protein [Polyangiales bacterium]